MTTKKTQTGCSDATHCSPAAWVLFGFFFVYGVVRCMDDTGIVFRHEGEAYFWFEPQLVEWIYGK